MPASAPLHPRADRVAEQLLSNVENVLENMIIICLYNLINTPSRTHVTIDLIYVPLKIDYGHYNVILK